MNYTISDRPYPPEPSTLFGGALTGTLCAKSRSATPLRTDVNRLFLSATVLPSRLLVISKSAKRSFIFFSDSTPLAKLSISVNICFRLVFRLSFFAVLRTIF